jgi:glycosyltransferase involved in cell wall biosynthesis
MAVVEPHIEVELSRSDFGLPEHATVFLFMFDFGSFATRKNPEAVINAFLQAFPAGDEAVHLLIKTSGAAAKSADWDRLRDLASDPRIELRDARLDRSEILNLIRSTDAFVSLHRSEGFGRGPAEAMLLGVPLIVTNYSGSTDYATPDCALIVDYELVPVRETDYPGVNGQCWAEANVASAARNMRWVRENPDEARALGARGRDQIRRLYNARTAGDGLLKALGVPRPRHFSPPGSLDATKPNRFVHAAGRSQGPNQ